MKKIIIVTLLTAFPLLMSAGGPWVQKKGKSYFKLSEWAVVFDQHFTSSGLLDPNVTTGVFNTFLYGEYGVTDQYTILLNSAVFSRTYVNNLVSGTTGNIIAPGGALNYFGDTDIGIKRSIGKSNRYPLAATVVLGLPTGKSSGGVGGNLQTGDGEFNQLVQLDVGHGFQSFGKNSSYYAAYLGFNHRTKGFSEEIRYGLEGGIAFFDSKTWLIARIAGVESLKNGLTAEDSMSTSIFANNTEFTSFSLELNQYLTQKIGISLGFAGAFRGEIIAAAPSYSFGVFLDLTK